jgi:hypothetical protein
VFILVFRCLAIGLDFRYAVAIRLLILAVLERFIAELSTKGNNKVV